MVATALSSPCGQGTCAHWLMQSSQQTHKKEVIYGKPLSYLTGSFRTTELVRKEERPQAGLWWLKTWTAHRCLPFIPRHSDLTGLVMIWFWSFYLKFPGDTHTHTQQSPSLRTFPLQAMLLTLFLLFVSTGFDLKVFWVQCSCRNGSDRRCTHKVSAIRLPKCRLNRNDTNGLAKVDGGMPMRPQPYKQRTVGT